MSTLFTRIIDGELPAEFVWRDERSVAFLSISPLTPGHTLVVPGEPIDHWLDCPRDLRDHLMEVAHSVGQAVRAAFGAERIGLIIAGFEVPHLHIHVFGAQSLADFSFAAARPASAAELTDAGRRIRGQLSGPGASGSRG